MYKQLKASIKSMAVAATVSALCFGAAGTANAAVPRGIDVGSPMSKTAFTFKNESGQRLLFAYNSGHVTEPSNNMQPGQSATVQAGDSDDPFKDDSGDVWFQMVNSSGDADGYLQFHTDGTRVENSFAQTWNLDRTAKTSNVFVYDNGGSSTDWVVEDGAHSGNTDVTVTPGANGWDTQSVSAFAKDHCQSDAYCSYDNVETTETLAPEMVLADTYNENDEGENNYVATQKEYESGSTTSWDSSVTASAELMDAVTLGVSKSHGTSVSSSHTFSTTQTASVPVGQTAVIFGQTPMISSTGDFSFKYGNTTFHLKNAQFAVPDQQRVIRYHIKCYDGDQRDNFVIDSGVIPDTQDVHHLRGNASAR